MLTPTLLVYFCLAILTLSVVMLVVVIKQARRNDRADREIIKQIGLLMDEELETLTHYRHIVQDLIRLAPERAEILEAVDLDLENRHDRLHDILAVVTAMVVRNRREERFQWNLLKGKYPDLFDRGRRRG